MVRLIVSGLRTYGKKDTVYAEITRYISEIGSVKEIVTGGSSVVEEIAQQYADENGIKQKEIAPDWQSHLNAGLIRDTRLAEYGTHLLVLSNGVSKGSNNLIDEAKQKSLTIKIVEIPDALEAEVQYFPMYSTKGVGI